MKRETIVYREATIRRRSQGQGWYIQTNDVPTGVSHSEEKCPHYLTLKDAREAARLWLYLPVRHAWDEEA